MILQKGKVNGRMLIGILSDTHGLLRQEVIDGLKGVDHIIHAGDLQCSHLMRIILIPMTDIGCGG